MAINNIYALCGSTLNRYFRLATKSRGHSIVAALLMITIVAAVVVPIFWTAVISSRKINYPSITATAPPTSPIPPATTVQAAHVKAKAPKRQPVTQMTFGNQSPIISDAGHDVEITCNSSSADLSQKQLENKK